jgi:hypothetical protein
VTLFGHMLPSSGACFGDLNDLPEADNEEQGDLSRPVLMNLFRDRPEFATPASIKEFLGIVDFDEVIGRYYHGLHPSVYKKCVEWVDKRRKVVTAESKAGIVATSVTELWQKLAQYSGIELNGAEKYFPFDPSSLVEKIEIFGNFRLGYSIGDCPGLGDIVSNISIRLACETYTDFVYHHLEQRPRNESQSLFAILRGGCGGR